MPVHDTGASVVPRIEEHKSVHRHHRYSYSFEVLNIKRVNLFLKFFSDDNDMPLAYGPLVEQKTMAVCYIIDVLPNFEWWHERVFLSLIVFSD